MKKVTKKVTKNMLSRIGTVMKDGSLLVDVTASYAVTCMAYKYAKPGCGDLRPVRLTPAPDYAVKYYWEAARDGRLQRGVNRGFATVKVGGLLWVYKPSEVSALGYADYRVMAIADGQR